MLVIIGKKPMVFKISLGTLQIQEDVYKTSLLLEITPTPPREAARAFANDFPFIANEINKMALDFCNARRLLVMDLVSSHLEFQAIISSDQIEIIRHRFGPNNLPSLS